MIACIAAPYVLGDQLNLILKMKIINNLSITASISLPIEDFLTVLRDHELTKEFYIRAHRLNFEAPIGLPHKKIVMLDIGELNGDVAKQFTFMQSVDQCLGDSITVFFIAPSPTDTKRSFIHPAINERIDPRDRCTPVFFDKLYDMIMKVKEI